MKNQKFDIIIQAGQSNADGTGYGPVSKEWEISPNIFYLNVEKTVEMLSDNMRITYADTPFQLVPADERPSENGPIGDFSLTFSKAYEDAGYLQGDRKLLIIRAAIGGTGFKKGQWGIGNPLYVKLVEMVDYALAQNPENRVVALLWHQGEHDAFEKNPPETFKSQIKAQMQDIRDRYGKNLPIIAGDFVNEWKSKNLDDCIPILEKIQETLVELGNGAFVQTADLPSNNQKISNGDDIHFCRESLHILGGRYFTAFESLEKV